MYAVSYFQKVWLLIYMTYDKKNMVRISYVGNIVHTTSKTPEICIRKWNFPVCATIMLLLSSPRNANFDKQNIDTNSLGLKPLRPCMNKYSNIFPVVCVLTIFFWFYEGFYASGLPQQGLLEDVVRTLRFCKSIHTSSERMTNINKHQQMTFCLRANFFLLYARFLRRNSF